MTNWTQPPGCPAESPKRAIYPVIGDFHANKQPSFRKSPNSEVGKNTSSEFPSFSFKSETAIFFFLKASFYVMILILTGFHRHFLF